MESILDIYILPLENIEKIVSYCELKTFLNFTAVNSYFRSRFQDEIKQRKILSRRKFVKRRRMDRPIAGDVLIGLEIYSVLPNKVFDGPYEIYLMDQYSHNILFGYSYDSKIYNELEPYQDGPIGPIFKSYSGTYKDGVISKLIYEYGCRRYFPHYNHDDTKMGAIETNTERIVKLELDGNYNVLGISVTKKKYDIDIEEINLLIHDDEDRKCKIYSVYTLGNIRHYIEDNESHEMLTLYKIANDEVVPYKIKVKYISAKF